MNKILNWTFGSLFRTIGRLFGFLIVCLLLLIIGSKLGFKLPDFLMPMYVYADEVEYTFSTNQSLVCVDKAGTQTCTSYKDNPYDANPSYPVELIKYRVKLSEGWSKDNVYTINVGFKPTPDAISVSSLNVCWAESGVCEIFTSKEGWFLNDLGYYRNIFSFSPTIDHPSDEYLYIYVRFNPGYLTTIRPSLLDTLSVSRGTDAIIKDQTNQIINQQDQTNEKLDNIEDAITDTSSPDVSDMTNLAGYLPPGPLDSVLNFPLSILNSLNNKLSSNCTPLSINLPFVDLPLNIPCISTIFGQINGLNNLWDALGVIFGALIMYSYLSYLYNWVDDVTSLRHNKARLFGAKSDANNWGGVD